MNGRTALGVFIAFVAGILLLANGHVIWGAALGIVVPIVLLAVVNQPKKSAEKFTALHIADPPTIPKS